jgi:beta-glucosidase
MEKPHMPTSAVSLLSPEQEARVESLLQQMTLEEKVALLAGQDSWNTVPIERLGIPSLTMTDGPFGVRTQPDPGRIHSPATAFPTGVSLAATWDPGLVEQAARAMAEETLALGCDILLGPCVNIVRHPLAGRNFETYSEDPYLAGKIGAAWVRGLQSQGVGASLKHFAANNQETERMRGSSEVDERTLREIYLPAFETIVKETQPWTVMCSYNRLNGVYASQHHWLLTEILRDEWGFYGAVVSDWRANHTVFESVAGGLDLEMPGPARFYGDLLVEAVLTWQIKAELVDQAARRILRLVARAGHLEPGASRPAGSLNTPAHQALALQVAEGAATLLKNEGGLLPLDFEILSNLAVIGPNAAMGGINGGGSSSVEPPYWVTPLQGLQEYFGDQLTIEYQPGCDNLDGYDPQDLPVLSKQLTRTEGGEAGLLGEYFSNSDLAGAPDVIQLEPRLKFTWFQAPPFEGLGEDYSLRYSGWLQVPESGRHTFGVMHTGFLRIYVDDELVLESRAQTDPSTTYNVSGKGSATCELAAGRDYRIRVEFTRLKLGPITSMRIGFAYTPDNAQDERLARAIELAHRSQAVVIFAGMGESFETEGADRPHMDLPGGQNELIQAVVQANPNTVVVLNAGAPVRMPWIDRARAVLLAYYPGLEGGRAVARLLAGQVNPSGKLPVTFPHRLDDTPAFLNFPGQRQAVYGEGIFVGYRYYDTRDMPVLFPFGHGLSYTQFEYSQLELPAQAQAGETIEVSLDVRNTGERAGAEIVQLYVSDLQAGLPRPPKELKGFQKIELQPGETQKLRFQLDKRAFAFYDPQRQDWVVEPGLFEILAGSSSTDLRLKGTIELAN